MSRLRHSPETCIVFVSYGRAELAARSYASLLTALADNRSRVRLVVSDASNDDAKIAWARSIDADDVIVTPRPTSAATSRNLAVSLIMDKYSTRHLCLLEDDFEYEPGWYPALVEAADRLWGELSPWGLAYGMFSACEADIPAPRLMDDPANGVKAYIFGAVAYQRFVPMAHYLSVMKCWDADVLGLSYAQTGGQTFRNTMRGYCGAIIPGGLSRPMADPNAVSTWRGGRRDVGPPAHSFNLEDYNVIRARTRDQGTYEP